VPLPLLPNRRATAPDVHDHITPNHHTRSAEICCRFCPNRHAAARRTYAAATSRAVFRMASPERPLMRRYALPSRKDARADAMPRMPEALCEATKGQQRAAPSIHKPSAPAREERNEAMAMRCAVPHLPRCRDLPARHGETRTRYPLMSPCRASAAPR